MSILGAISGGLSIAKGISGLFGGGSSKVKQPDIAKNIRDQARGAREAADESGFNPLTMLQYGNPAGAGFNSASGAPPLASIDSIVGGLQSVDDIVSGDAARRRAADELELDMAKVKLDQLRSGVSVPMSTPVVASGVGGSTSPIGNRPARVVQSNVSTPSRGKFSQGENPIATGRQTDIVPMSNSAGVFEMENTMTGGPITIPGDGEPWGIDELATAVVIGGPQVVNNGVKKARSDHEKLKKLRETDEDAYKRELKRRQKMANDRAPKDANSRSWNSTFQIPNISN